MHIGNVNGSVIDCCVGRIACLDYLMAELLSVMASIHIVYGMSYMYHTYTTSYIRHVC